MKERRENKGRVSGIRPASWNGGLETGERSSHMGQSVGTEGKHLRLPESEASTM